jgi:DNA repair exonuclease SbcCD ATPase subunit
MLGPCLAKNPDQRTSRMQKVLMELKLLSVAARRAETTEAAPVRRETVEPNVMRAEMRELESRLEGRFVARLQAQERNVAEIQNTAADSVGAFKVQLTALTMEVTETRETSAEMYQTANNAVDGLREQLTALIAELSGTRETSAEMHRTAADAMGALKGQLSALSTELAQAREQMTRPSGELDALAERILARVDHGFETASEHISRIETTLEELRQHTTQFETSAAADLGEIEQNLKLQAASIESARSAMAQTDDLVERVVEALESLQTAVLDQGDNTGTDRPSFAVN